MELMNGGSSVTVATSTVSTRAYRSHSEAERKRRQRINGHLATLRTLIPAATRMDKATLLGEVVRYMRELHESADDVALAVPTERDEIQVEEEEEGRVRTRVCCSDRPGLMTELNRVIHSVRARPVRAEIATVGGRTKSTIDLEFETDGRSALFAALQSVLASNGPNSTGSVGTCKRQCLTKRVQPDVNRI